MNKIEYNQNMIDHYGKCHSKVMHTCLDEHYGRESKYSIYSDVAFLVGRELTFAAIEAENERAHATRFNHILNREARITLMKRKHAQRRL